MDPVVINTLIIPIAGMLTGIILGLPLIRAAVRYVERKSGGGGDPRLRAELEEIRNRLEVMDEMSHRLLELEERIDFTERVLAQTKDRHLARGE